MGLERRTRFLFFYGKMVSDTEIQKVLIISDKKYADKANGRDGGVGTETQIISAEVYKNRQQEKFVAAVVERDETGEAYLPVYYKSRIYIDFVSQKIMQIVLKNYFVGYMINLYTNVLL